MSFLNPSPSTALTKYITFDTPLDVAATNARSNLDPALFDGEAWSDAILGNPPHAQGCPLVIETSNPVHAGDPSTFDLILDLGSPAAIFFTFRLTGDLVPELANANHYANIYIDFDPLIPGSAIPQNSYLNGVSMLPGANAANTWFLNSENELVFTRQYDFTPMATPPSNFEAGKVYRVIVRCEIWHTVNGGLHQEMFMAFDDSVTIQIHG